MKNKINLVQRIKLHLYQNRYFQRITGGLSFELKPKKWIFIVGCYNSGTTLLDAILRSHPQISGFPCEAALLSDCLPTPEQYGWTRMWHKCVDKMRIPLSKDSEKIAIRIRRQWAWCVETGNECIVEKSISNATRIAFLNRFFDNSYFIYIVRNGYAVSEGIRRRANPAKWGNNDFSGGYSLELCAKQWLFSDLLLRNELQKVERHITVRYEDLTDKTLLTVNGIAQFVDIDPFDNEVSATRWNIGGVSSVIRNMNADSLQRLNEMEVEEIYNTAKEALCHYGYRAVLPAE